MSSILKALKKVENDKAPARGKVAPLTRDLLAEEGAPRPLLREPRGRFWLVVVAGILAGAAAGGYLLVGPGGLKSTGPASEMVVRNNPPAKPVTPDVVPVENIPAENIPAEVTPDKKPVVSAERTEAEPSAAQLQIDESAKVVEEVTRVTTTLKDTAQALKATASVLKNKVIVAADRGKVVSPSVPAAGVKPAPAPKYASYKAGSPALVAGDGVSKSVERPTSVSVAVASRKPGWNLGQLNPGPEPELVVSEIHYRPSVKDRLAVVNDLPVMEGVDIEGARVDRIFKDRIRFVINGQYKEVLLKTKP